MPISRRYIFTGSVTDPKSETDTVLLSASFFSGVLSLLDPSVLIFDDFDVHVIQTS